MWYIFFLLYCFKVGSIKLFLCDVLLKLPRERSHSAELQRCACSRQDNSEVGGTWNGRFCHVELQPRRPEGEGLLVWCQDPAKTRNPDVQGVVCQDSSWVSDRFQTWKGPCHHRFLYVVILDPSPGFVGGERDRYSYSIVKTRLPFSCCLQSSQPASSFFCFPQGAKQHKFPLHLSVCCVLIVCYDLLPL